MEVIIRLCISNVIR